jgi:hypothetical protein
MTSHLSSSRLQQLTPVLASVARIIAGGSQLSESELQILLYGVDLEYDPELLKELRIWGRLLQSVEKRPDKELRRATAEALMLRGLPEASVLLAIDTVTSRAVKRHVSSQSSTLQVSSSTLDFGSLVPGQTAVLTFDVQGGPGQIMLESDQLCVTPCRFGAELTSIRVEVIPINGGLLWTVLKLVTREETLEVPVLAQWADPASAARVVVSDPYVSDRSLSPVMTSAQNNSTSLEMIEMIEQAIETDIYNDAGRPQSTTLSDNKQISQEDIVEQINRMLG